MKKIITIFLAYIIVSCSTNHKVSDGLLYWNGPKSLERLSHSAYKVDFVSLSNHFAPQDNGIFCGLASSAIILNSLRERTDYDIPRDTSSISINERKFIPKKYNPFLKKYTQRNVLHHKVKGKMDVLGKPKKLKGKYIKDFGLQLEQLARTLETHGLEVKKYVVKDMNKKILDIIKDNLKTPNNYILVNYDRKSLGQSGGGHISPLAAYDQLSDSFLIMDVNSNKYPWVWVPAQMLLKSMATFDTVENRGFLEISEK